ncbi:DUF2190 family protein [Hyphomonas sp. ND6WE1B]|uniref:DUF2190 family protein n=1 Tax=Hyphomonas sp. ND6WE1B TaxID=1848191 RepID=UPI0008076325|nr:capsid cement protein [Hyphomonas sp. ND6WE1B]
MKNFIQPGHTLTVPAPAAVSSGDLVIVGSLFGVASGDADNGDDLDLVTGGVFTLPKLTTAVFTVGEDVYWDAAAEQCEEQGSTGADLKIGVCVAAAGNGATSVAVRLSGHF